MKPEPKTPQRADNPARRDLLKSAALLGLATLLPGSETTLAAILPRTEEQWLGGF